MKMSDFPKLENGMVVVTRNGEVALVVNNNLLFNEGYIPVSEYEKWTYGWYVGRNNRFDISKVYSGAKLSSINLEKYVSEYGEDALWDNTVMFYPV